MHVIAGKAVAFKLAAGEAFREDQRRTIENAQAMAETLPELGARVVSGGTDNHLMLVDVTPLGRDRQGGRAPPRRDRHHRQQERHPVRPAAAEHGVGDPDRHAGHDVTRALVRTRCARSAGSSSRRSEQRDDPAAQARLAGDVREIVDRFPVPGLPAA